MGGQLSGTISFYGSHTSCLKMIHYEASDPSESFGGKYCLVRLKPPMPPKPNFVVINKPMNVMENYTMKSEIGYELVRLASKFYVGSFQLGICLPSICTDDDIQQIVRGLSSKVGFHGNVHYCESSRDLIQLEWDQIVVFATLAVFFSLTIVATTLGCCCKASDKKIGEDEGHSSSLTTKLVRAFSIDFNSRKIFAVSEESTKHAFSCLHGLKFLTVGWIISEHTITLASPYAFRDGIKAEELGDQFTFQVMSSGTVSLDTFLFITAVLVSYEIVNTVDRKGVKYFNIPLQIIRRLWRRLPSVMMILGLLTILPLLGSGPNWKEETETPLRITRSHWWTVLLCISNLFPTQREPLMHLWYVSADIQLFILSSLLLRVFYKWKRVTYVIMLFLAALSMFLNGFMIYIKDVLPVYIVTAPEKGQILDFLYYGLKLPYCHISSYFLGMTLGIYFGRNHKRNSRSKWLVKAGWLLALALLFVPLFYPFKYAFGDLPSAAEAFVYASFCRTIWALGLFVMVYLCATNNGGVINEFLSWKPFVALSRLTYLVYLLHVVLTVYFSGSLRGVVDAYGHIIVWLSAGTIALAHLVAFVMKIFFEAPLDAIEKIVSEKVLRKKDETNVKIPQNHNNTEM